jgi:trigger factor
LKTNLKASKTHIGNEEASASAGKKLHVEDISQTRKKIAVTFTAHELDEVSKHVVSSIAKYAKIPGFRAGKAPADMIKKHYAKGFQEEFRKELLTKAFDEAKKTLSIASIVKVENFEMIDRQPIDIQLVVDVFCDFPLPNYKGISVTSLPTVATDEDVTKALSQLQKERAKFTVVDRPAKPSDYVKISYTGTLNGELIKDIANVPAIFGTQNNTWEEAGSQQQHPHISAITEGIIGMQAKDRQTVTETFPEDFSVPELAGKKASYDIEVHEVRERELPPLNEAFFTTLGAKTLEELQEKTKEQIVQQKDYENHVHQRQQITEKILQETTQFPIPASEEQAEITHILQEMVENAAQRGMSKARMEEHKKAFFDKAKEVATNNIRLYLILDKIAETEKITVSNEDLQRALYQEAMAKRMKPDQLLKEIRQDSDHLQRLKQNALYTKTIDFIQKNIKTP